MLDSKFGSRDGESRMAVNIFYERHELFVHTPVRAKQETVSSGGTSTLWAVSVKAAQPSRGSV